MEDHNGLLVVSFAGQRTCRKSFDQLIHSLSDLFAVLEIAFVRTVEVEQLRMVITLIMFLVLVATFVTRTVERYECRDEVVDLGLSRVVVEGDVGVVEKILVVDLEAVEDLGDVLLVVQVCLAELFLGHKCWG